MRASMFLSLLLEASEVGDGKDKDLAVAGDSSWLARERR